MSRSIQCPQLLSDVTMNNAGLVCACLLDSLCFENAHSVVIRDRCSFTCKCITKLPRPLSDRSVRNESLNVSHGQLIDAQEELLQFQNGSVVRLYKLRTLRYYRLARRAHSLDERANLNNDSRTFVQSTQPCRLTPKHAPTPTMTRAVIEPMRICLGIGAFRDAQAMGAED